MALEGDMQMSNITVKFDSLNKILKGRGLEVKGKVQKFVDSEVLRLSSPYVPHLSGTLEKKRTLGDKRW